MKNKSKNIMKLYGVLGKSLCCCAGGIIGFVIGGPLLGIPGALAGILGGHFLEKGVANPSL